MILYISSYIINKVSIKNKSNCKHVKTTVASSRLGTRRFQ